MKLQELIRSMRLAAGFSATESQDALELMVESIAERLPADERQDFASQLPLELQDVALDAVPIGDIHDLAIIEEFMEKELVDESRAKRQVLSAWEALKSTISDGALEHIRAQLTTEANALLH